jgi:hypothetical protein
VKPITLDEDYSYALHQTGGISTLTVTEPVDDVVAKLHAVIKEVTGKAVEPPPKPRMGFLL